LSLPGYTVFTYKIGFKKTGNSYRLDYYNTPYEDTEREMDDICVMFRGITINGDKLPQYKAVAWEGLADGPYEVVVKVHFIPIHGRENEFDQTFEQLSIEPLFKESSGDD